MAERAGQVSPWGVDALLGVAVTLALALIMTTSGLGTRPPDVIAYLFATGFGALMLVRRSMPRTVLVLSVLGMFAYYAFGYPPIGVAIPVVAAVFSAAEAGLMLWPVTTSVVVFAVSMFFRVLEGGEAIGFLVGYESVTNGALFAAAIGLGFGVRTRRVQATQQTEIVRLTQAQLAREGELRLQAERERISRDLHDTVGHTMSVISLQAGVAAEAIGHDDDAAVEALEQIRTASTRSLRDLRTMVRILRSTGDADGIRHVQSLSAVQELVDVAASAGIEVSTEITAAPGDLSAPVDVAAYRVIQEAITNVVRHAGATRAQVNVLLQDGTLRIRVSDNGRGPAADASPAGYGIAGMTERVRLLGGSLTTGSRAGVGFTVEATIPAGVS